MKYLNYETAGDPNRPAIILMHGILSSNYQWVYNKDALAEHYYVVLVEMWDHGGSPDSSSIEDHEPDVYAEQLLYIYDKLGISSAAVIGQSIGAGILVHFAHRHPEKVAVLAFTNSKVVVTDLNQSLKKLSERTGGKFDNMRDEKLFKTEEEKFAFRRKFPLHPVHAKRMPEEVKDEFIRIADDVRFELIQYGPKLGLILCCRQHLSGLTMPVLVVNGAFEKDLQPHIAILKEDFPHFHVVDISAGHNVNLDAADKFNQVVLDFFKEHYPSQPAASQLTEQARESIAEEVEPA